MRTPHEQLIYDKVRKKGAPIFIILGLIIWIGIISVCVSPLIWVWMNGILAFKILISGLVLTLIPYWFDRIVHKSYTDVYGAKFEDEIKEMNEQPLKQSKFQQRMNEMMEKSKFLKEERTNPATSEEMKKLLSEMGELVEKVKRSGNY
jgi:hypothetical protein